MEEEHGTKEWFGSQRARKKVSSILGGVAATYLVLCFLAPLLMPTDSVPELSGRANAIDYAFESSWGNKDHGEGGKVGHDQSQHCLLYTSDAADE